MLKSIVGLLDGLSLIAVMLAMVFGVVGSIVTALRAVGRKAATSPSSPKKMLDGVSNRSEGLLHAQPQKRSADSVLKSRPGESRTSPRKAEHVFPTR
jgi:hypothetical protein